MQKLFLEKKVEQINKKVNLAELRRSNRETKQVDLSIQTVKPLQKLEVKKKVVPMWKREHRPISRYEACS